MVSRHSTDTVMRLCLWLALAAMAGLASPAGAAKSRKKEAAERKSGESKKEAEGEEKAKEDTRPVVLFFIMDGSEGPLRSTGCMMAVMSSIGRVNSRLKTKSKDYEEIKAIAKVVFHEKRLDDVIRDAIRNLRVPKNERKKGVSAVFLSCQGKVGEPEKKRDRPKDEYDPRRYQADVTVECEACRVSLRRDRIRKKGAWKKKFETTYITPAEQPKDKPLETSNTAMQKAAEKVVERFFAAQEKWLE